MGTDARVGLGQLRNDGPVLLVFGSYTCPNFRSAADTLNKIYPEYKNRIPFYLIYIREAHSTNDWASTRNQREGIVLEPAKNMGEPRITPLCVFENCTSSSLPSLIAWMDQRKRLTPPGRARRIS